MSMLVAPPRGVNMNICKVPVDAHLFLRCSYHGEKVATG